MLKENVDPVAAVLGVALLSTARISRNLHRQRGNMDNRYHTTVWHKPYVLLCSQGRPGKRKWCLLQHKDHFSAAVTSAQQSA